MNQTKTINWVAVCVFLFALSLAASQARADAILPGFDLFQTAPGTMVLIPGVGTVQLKGMHIGPFNTDTIVQRMGGLTLPGGGMGTIPIELVALSLTSVTPVNIGGSFFDVFVTLQPGTMSTGQMTVTFPATTTGTGTFSSFFDVFFQIGLRQVGNPANTKVITLQDIITGNGTWSHMPPPGYPINPHFPSGGFFPGPLSERGTNFSLLHNVRPASTPEPTSIILLATGMAGILGLGRKRFFNFYPKAQEKEE